MALGDRKETVTIPAGPGVRLAGDLVTLSGGRGLVLFAHGSGSSRASPRNRTVARALWRKGLCTLLFDLLTESEEAVDAVDAHLRFDIALLTRRLISAASWARSELGPDIELGYFGASTGSAAALAAAAERPGDVSAIVSRGGRPDLAEGALARVRAPTMLIVGGRDAPVLDLNRKALDVLAGPKELAVIPGASHLFEEPGALDEVARLAAGWFSDYLAPAGPSDPAARGG